MAWDERPHYRDRSGASANPLRWLLGGSAPIAPVFGVRFRAHSTLVLFIFAILLFDWGRSDYPISVRAFSMGLWVVMLAAHELAHCIIARRLGGQADEAILWPGGGLAHPEPPHRPSASLITAIAGPLVNLLLCAVGAACVYALTPTSEMRASVFAAPHVLVPLNPFHGPAPDFAWKWSDPAFYWWWVFLINYRLLLLNLLPVYPLDGARILQSALWPIVGYFRSMVLETSVGMAGAVAMGLVALAMREYFLFVAMMFCFYEAYQARMLLHENAGDDWKDSFDFGSSLFTEERPRRRRRLSRRVIRKARKIAEKEKAARDRVEAILAKVSLGGITSLTWIERRTLRRTTQAHRRRESEMSQFQ